ncbi:MAG: hypothetical protein PHR25_03765 [Clostridia bacterium]|nr:hypothetical protein [Clostridia bacterium]MDD4375879.1 hypothetical protein [Clostridia bacterium]
MSKSTWIYFIISFVVIIALVLVALLIFVPQNAPKSLEVLKEYEEISESDFSYTHTKDVPQENLKETYGITSEDIKEGKSAKMYKQGNTDPFTSETSEASTNPNPGTGTEGNSGADKGGEVNKKSDDKDKTNLPNSAEDK